MNNNVASVQNNYPSEDISNVAKHYFEYKVIENFVNQSQNKFREFDSSKLLLGSRDLYYSEQRGEILQQNFHGPRVQVLLTTDIPNLTRIIGCMFESLDHYNVNETVYASRFMFEGYINIKFTVARNSFSKKSAG